MDIKKLLNELSTKEKCSLLVGKDAWRTKNIDRLGIPSLFMADGPHGLRKVISEGHNISEPAEISVCYPSLVTLASSFDPKISYKMGSAIAKEFKSQGVDLILGPGVNIKRHPFCGRNFEYFSEDPILTIKMAEGFIKGAKAEKIGVCLKHYAFNSQESYRMTSSTIVDSRAKHEIYYKSFRELVKLDPEMVMCSYNKIDGIYASENYNTLKEVLRDEFGFNNVIVSDWTAVNNRTDALIATLDLEMPGYIYGINTMLRDLKSGKLTRDVLDESCKRMLEMVSKFKNQEKISVDLEKHHQIARDISVESMVLLKNDDDLLPLESNDKVLLVGEMAEKTRYQGGGSSHINSYKVDSIYDVLTKHSTVDYAKGYESLSKDNNSELLAEAINKAAIYDKIIIICGLTDEFESEGYDRIHLSIPKNQEYLINQLSKVNPNIVLLIQTGSPIVMPFIRNVKAILNCYLAGEAIGQAVEKLLYGKANPSGRLAETFPKKSSDIAANDYFAKGNNNVFYRESIYVGYRYYQTANIDVLFPFGYGLSYSHFEYSNLKLNKKTLKTDKDIITLSIDISNNSQYAGKEVVLLFFEAKSPKIPRPKRELLAFDKLMIKASETKTVNFKVKIPDLCHYNPEIGEFIVDDGTYNLQICKNSRDILVESSIEVKQGIDPIPSVWNELISYNAMNGLEFAKIDFEKLINQKVKDEHIVHTRPFTINNNLEDIEHTFIGKTIKKRIIKEVDKALVNQSDNYKLMVTTGIKEQPIRSLVLFSGGQIKMHIVEFLLAIINRKYLKAVKYLFRKD
ncbi:glycoside hydrolase family 3 C-terminal domain-containing protein [Mycoplasmatota bacterium WC30]